VPETACGFKSRSSHQSDSFSDRFNLLSSTAWQNSKTRHAAPCRWPTAAPYRGYNPVTRGPNLATKSFVGGYAIFVIISSEMSSFV
jgi:hypothetical protein